MRILKYSYLVKASIGHVHFCHSDLDFVCNVLKEIKDDNKVKVVKKDQELHFIEKDTKLQVKILESNRPSYLKLEITPLSENINWLGAAIVDCNFFEDGIHTKVIIEMSNNKNPNVLVKAFVKVIARILRFQSRSNEKLGIQAIEQCA